MRYRCIVRRSWLNNSNSWIAIRVNAISNRYSWEVPRYLFVLGDASCCFRGVDFCPTNQCAREIDMPRFSPTSQPRAILSLALRNTTTAFRRTTALPSSHSRPRFAQLLERYMPPPGASLLRPQPLSRSTALSRLTERDPNLV